jgi:hypothetical protein
MSMESKIANTGPIGATITPMTLDMCGTAGCFGRLNLPEIKTSSSGTTVTVTDQKIEIVDMDAFIAFNKSSTPHKPSSLLIPLKTSLKC